MRKTINRTTVIVVLVIFLCLSVGYALFSDTITIEGNATAQGTFDIEVACLTEIPEDVVNAVSSESSLPGSDNIGYSNETCTVSDNVVTYSVGLEYPGAEKWYAIKLTNVGSIDASFSGNVVENQFGQETIEIYNSKTNELINTVNGSDDFFRYDIYLPVKKDGSYINIDDESAENTEYFLDLIDENNPYYLIREGASMYFIFWAKWPQKDYAEDGVYYKSKQTITFPFEQYNG